MKHYQNYQIFQSRYRNLSLTSQTTILRVWKRETLVLDGMLLQAFNAYDKYGDFTNIVYNNCISLCKQNDVSKLNDPLDLL